MNNFSKNLVFIRKGKGLNQKHMAEYLKIKPSTYANYETGFSKPELETFLSISKLLRMSMDDLINKNLSTSKQYMDRDKLNSVADSETSVYEKKQAPPNRHEELLFKIIQLNEKLLVRTEELRMKDNSIAELTEKVKYLEELLTKSRQ